MKRVLVKIKDKSLLLILRQYGSIETISSIFSVYAITVNDKKIHEIKKLPGIISVEEDETYTIQSAKSKVC